MPGGGSAPRYFAGRELKPYEVLPPGWSSEHPSWAVFDGNLVDAGASWRPDVAPRSQVPAGCGGAGKPCGCAGCGSSASTRSNDPPRLEDLVRVGPETFGPATPFCHVLASRVFRLRQFIEDRWAALAPEQSLRERLQSQRTLLHKACSARDRESMCAALVDYEHTLHSEGGWGYAQAATTACQNGRFTPAEFRWFQFWACLDLRRRQSQREAAALASRESATPITYDNDIEPLVLVLDSLERELRQCISSGYSPASLMAITVPPYGQWRENWRLPPPGPLPPPTPSLCGRAGDQDIQRCELQSRPDCLDCCEVFFNNPTGHIDPICYFRCATRCPSPPP